MVKLTRKEPAKPGGPIEANVPESEIQGFLDAGWERAGTVPAKKTVAPKAKKKTASKKTVKK